MEDPEGERSDPCLYTVATTHSFMGSVKDATHCMMNHDEAWVNSRHIEGKPECWQTASGTGPEQSEPQIPTIHTEVGDSFSSSTTPHPGYTHNVVQCNINTTGPSDVQNSAFLGHPTAYSAPDIVDHVDNNANENPFALGPYPYGLPMNMFTRKSPTSIGGFQSPTSLEYLDFRTMLYRSDKLLETYEKVSCTLFTLHRKRTILGESAACVYTIDGLFRCVSTLCDLLETTVPAANALIDRAGYITNNGIFKLGLMGISIALEIYENLLHNYQRVSCPEDFSGEKISHDVVQLCIASDTMELANIILRCTFMDIHLRRLRTTLEAASLELNLDPSLSTQIEETKAMLDAFLCTLQKHVIYP